MHKLGLDVADGEYAVARLEPDADSPAYLLGSGVRGLVSVSRTPQELSIVCLAALAPKDAAVESGWRLLSVRGPLPFMLTGIIAALSSELAAAGIALFTLSTFDTDHLLVRSTDLDRAVTTLRAAGHDVAMN